MAEHLEIEQKFDVDTGFERPSFGGLSGVTAAEPVLHHLSATYFDTHDKRLAAAKITLRRRTGGTDEGWHLKLPASAGARREIQAPLGAAELGVPPELAERVAEVTGGLPLAPIARLDTERTVVALAGDDGRLRAEVADDAVTGRRLPEGAAQEGAGQAGTGQAGTGQAGTGQEGTGRAGTGPLRWREVEVEVMAADPALQRAAADVLLSAGARPAGHGSKLARVLDEAPASS